MRNIIILFSIFSLFLLSKPAFSQCNTNTILCNNTGVMGPFNFIQGSLPNPSSCLDFINGANSNNYAYIYLYISAPGQLNLLVNGNSNNGFLDVAVFDVTNLTNPCTQVSVANELQCNYATSSSGCAQFGTQFACPSSINAPNVNAGDMIMILVEDWSNNSTSFTMELSNSPGSAQSSLPDATITPAGPFCIGDAPVQLNAVNMGGTWTGPSVTTTGIFDPTAAGVGIHTINYEIGSGTCIANDQTQITVNSGAAVTAEVQGTGLDAITICEGESLTLEASGSSTYLWNNGLGAGAIQNVSPIDTTVYIVEGTDVDGCKDKDTVTVNVSPAVNITVSPDEVICATTATDIEANASGGTTFDYHWSHTASNDPIQTVTPTDPSTTYTVYAENEFGCESAPQDITIELHPEPLGTISDDQIICPGYSAFLTAEGTGGAGGPYTYTWVDGSGNVVSNQDSFSVSPVNTTTYTVEINDVCGTLPIFLSTEVVVSPLPDIQFSVDLDNKCIPATFEITNDTDPGLVEETYWYFSDGQTFQNTDNFEIFIDQAGTFDLQLVVVTPDGCIDSTEVNDFLTVHPSPQANFNFYPDPVTMLNTEVQFQNYSLGAEEYQWFLEGADPDYSSLKDPVTVYPEGEVDNYEVELVVTSIHNCTDTARAIVQVESEVLMFAPNTFTPDGDELNATWRVYIDGIDVQQFDLEIYNRWGELIWESHNPEIGWDGTYGNQGGREVEPGTYVWKVRTRDYINDRKYEWQGHVTVLK